MDFETLDKSIQSIMLGAGDGSAFMVKVERWHHPKTLTAWVLYHADRDVHLKADGPIALLALLRKLVSVPPDQGARVGEIYPDPEPTQPIPIDPDAKGTQEMKAADPVDPPQGT